MHPKKLTRLPREELDDDRYDEVDLIAAPDGHAEPGFVMKVSMRRFGVWRRLRLPGELTVYGLHMVIQAAFGWDGDHLHTLRTGPFTFAPAWPVLEEAIPSEMVSLADLATLGVRELSYRYDLGDCWDHEITMEKVLPPGEVTRRVPGRPGHHPGRGRRRLGRRRRRESRLGRGTRARARLRSRPHQPRARPRHRRTRRDRRPGAMRVLSVDRGEEPQQAETSKTRPLSLPRPAPSREHAGTSPAPGARRRGAASRR
jgi:Plasmid pRiA4b ORF-3-like protein